MRWGARLLAAAVTLFVIAFGVEIYSLDARFSARSTDDSSPSMVSARSADGLWSSVVSARSADGLRSSVVSAPSADGLWSSAVSAPSADGLWSSVVSARSADGLWSSARSADEYVGSAACARRHKEDYEEWKVSLHVRMTKPIAEAEVLVDFDDARLTAHGRSFEFALDKGRRVMRVSFGGRRGSPTTRALTATVTNKMSLQVFVPGIATKITRCRS